MVTRWNKNDKNSKASDEKKEKLALAVQAVNPFLPKPISEYAKEGIKVARPDIIVQDDTLSSELMTDLIFEEIGGQELLASSRSDLINSPLNISYSPIKNQRLVNLQFEPSKILSVIDRGSSMMSTLSLADYEPYDGFIDIVDNKYSVTSEGNIEIKFVNMSNADKVEIQVYGFDDSYGATIY